jgi:hypothetical protein
VQRPAATPPQPPPQPPPPPAPAKTKAATDKALQQPTRSALSLPNVAFPTSFTPPPPPQMTKQYMTYFQTAAPPPPTSPSTTPKAAGPPIVKGLVLRAATPVRRYLQLVESVPRRMEAALPRVQQGLLQRATAVGAGAGALAVSGSTAAQISAMLAQQASTSIVEPLLQSVQAIVSGMMGSAFEFGASAATESTRVVAQQIAVASNGVLSATAPVVQAAAQQILQESMASQFLAMLGRISPMLVTAAFMLTVMAQSTPQSR